MSKWKGGNVMTYYGDRWVPEAREQERNEALDLLEDIQGILKFRDDHRVSALLDRLRVKESKPTVRERVENTNSSTGPDRLKRAIMVLADAIDEINSRERGEGDVRT